MVYDVRVRRTNIYMAESQLGMLRKVSESRGRPVAELVRDAVDSWLAAQGLKEIPQDEWQARFDALMARRRAIAEQERFSEEEVLRDANAAVREVRRMRTARRR